MLDKYYHTKDIYYTREKMLAYLHNELPDFEKRAFDKLLSEDAFLRDALAGLKMQSAKQNLQSFKKIEADIDIITGAKKPRIIALGVRNIAVAAMIIVFFAVSFLIINQLNKTEQQKIAAIQAEEYPQIGNENIIKDSVLQNRNTDIEKNTSPQITNPAESSIEQNMESVPVTRSDESKSSSSGTQRDAVNVASKVEESEGIYADEALDKSDEELDFQEMSKKEVVATQSTKSKATDEAAVPAANDAAVFITVEQMPEFPGGEQALYNFLSENIEYPAEAKDAEVEGTVYVKFLVNKKGKINDVQVVKGIGSGCDAEAERVVKKMPDWNPAMQDGIAVDVLYTLPIKFQLK